MLQAKLQMYKERIEIGYYDIPVITKKIAEAIVEKEFEKVERRKFPRITFN